jgi:hypothetical protein
MLLVLISIVWVTLLALFAAVCRVAADGDGRSGPALKGGPVSLGTKLTLSSAGNARPAQQRRGPRLQPALSRETRRRRPTHAHRVR